MHQQIEIEPSRKYLPRHEIFRASNVPPSTAPTRVLDRFKGGRSLNRPIREALGYFDFLTPSGIIEGPEYEAFAHFMGRFRKESGAPDMLALDAFFYTLWSRGLGKAK